MPPVKVLRSFDRDEIIPMEPYQRAVVSFNGVARIAGEFRDEFLRSEHRKPVLYLRQQQYNYEKLSQIEAAAELEQKMLDYAYKYKMPAIPFYLYERTSYHVDVYDNEKETKLLSSNPEKSLEWWDRADDIERSQLLSINLLMVEKDRYFFVRRPYLSNKASMTAGLYTITDWVFPMSFDTVFNGILKSDVDTSTTTYSLDDIFINGINKPDMQVNKRSGTIRMRNQKKGLIHDYMYTCDWFENEPITNHIFFSPKEYVSLAFRHPWSYHYDILIFSYQTKSNGLISNVINAFTGIYNEHLTSYNGYSYADSNLYSPQNKPHPTHIVTRSRVGAEVILKPDDIGLNRPKRPE